MTGAKPVRSKRRMTGAERQAEAARKHELQMALLDWLKTDDEAKYWLAFTAGCGAAGLGAILSGFDAPLTGQNVGGSSGTAVKPVIPDWAFLISPGLMASPLALPNWMKWSSGTSTGPGSLTELAGGVMALMGTGYAGFNGGILVLKAIFGDQGAAEVLKGIGEIVPG